MYQHLAEIRFVNIIENILYTVSLFSFSLFIFVFLIHSMSGATWVLSSNTTLCVFKWVWWLYLKCLLVASECGKKDWWTDTQGCMDRQQQAKQQVCLLNETHHHQTPSLRLALLIFFVISERKDLASSPAFFHLRERQTTPLSVLLCLSTLSLSFLYVNAVLECWILFL